MRWILIVGAVTAALATAELAALAPPPEGKPRKGPLNLNPPAVSTDPSVKLDYPIVYVRLPRKGFKGVPKSKFENPVWAQAGVPLQMHQGADLMLLHPSG